jgi:hypothetical protein
LFQVNELRLSISGHEIYRLRKGFRAKGRSIDDSGGEPKEGYSHGDEGLHPGEDGKRMNVS